MLPQLSARRRSLSHSVAVLATFVAVTVVASCLAMTVAVVTVLLMQHLGLLEGVAFAGNGSEESAGGKEVKRLHRRRF